MSQALMSTLLSALLLAASVLPAQAHAPSSRRPNWVVSWGAAQMVPDSKNELAAEHWRDATLRQIVPLSLGGKRLRVRISNVYGSGVMTIHKASVALALAPGNPNVDARTLKALTFSGRAGVTIPAGAEYYSDPVAFGHKARADLAISFHVKEAPGRQTSHPGARTHSFHLRGDKVMDAEWQDPGKVTRWYQLADVEVEAPRGVGALVALGDSITDGYGVTTDGNDRWTDVFSRRALASGKPIGILNAGIGGGRLLRDGLGPNLMSRFERDVLGRAGVTHVMVLIGVNDLGGQHRGKDDTPEARKALVDDMMEAHRQLVERAHTHGICVIGATIAPYTGNYYYNPGPANEADRQVINGWIRSAKVFDAVADVDAALRDPKQPDRLAPEFDSGDHLHPSLAGYRAIADAVPLDALRGCAYKQ